MQIPFIGNHQSIKKIRELVSMVSELSLNVLLLGETGTGKDVVARYLHSSSPRKNKKFMKVNCAALPQSLLESELFGYERGAFTGADKLKPGRFEQASDGVMFLDEIGDMPLSLQAKLLNVLQSGEYNRLGGTESIKVDSWVISSTNHDLDRDIRDGLFREDLFYRLNVIKIEMPPLRKRKDDIPLLIEYFVNKNRNELNVDDNLIISPDLNRVFIEYDWPGNVRELSSTILRLMMGDFPEDIKNEIIRNMEADSHTNNPEEGSFSVNNKDNEEAKVIKSLKIVKAEASSYIEKMAIAHVLNLTSGNKSEAARLLKISYKTLFNKIDELGI